MTTSWKFSSRLIALVIATIGTVFALAASANAATYCVNDPACPAGGVAKGTVDNAVSAANASADHDTIRIGSGTYTAPSDVTQPTDIIGSGPGSTELDAAAGATSALSLLTGQAKVTDLTVRVTADHQVGILLRNGASAHRVRVIGAHTLTSVDGLVVGDPVSDISQVTVDLGHDYSNYGINDLGGATISDADITAGIGIEASYYGTIVRRAVVHATYPLRVVGGTLNIANALLRPPPDAPEADGFEAIGVENDAGNNALLNAADVTIAGPGYGTGLSARSNYADPGGSATANVAGMVISGVENDMYRHGKSLSEMADIKIDHSAYNASNLQLLPGFGDLTVGPGNITDGPDPRFVNPAAGDYRLRYDSPLLDKGPTTEPLSDDDPDLAGQSRVRDSDGNGSAIRDIGAYEYQRLAPTAAFEASAGSPASFDARASNDPDGDPLTFSWAFGDGASGPGAATTSHAFSAPGSYLTTLTVTDPTGQSATAAKSIAIAAGASAPVISGLKQSARSWLERNKLPHIASKKIGTTFRFKLDQPAKVRFVFSRRGKRTGALTFAAHSGANKLRFLGRISKMRKLRPGRYTVTVTATNAAGKQSKPQSLSFKIARS